MIIPPLVQSITEKLPDGVQKFEHSQVQSHFWTTLLQSMTPGLLWQTAELSIIVLIYDCINWG